MKRTGFAKQGKQQVFKPTFGSVRELLLHHSKQFGNKEAIISVDVDSGKHTVISYQGLFELVQRAAVFLASKDVQQGDRIAFAFENSAVILVLELAAGLLGASSVPIDVKRDTPDRKAFKLKDANVKVCFENEAEVLEGVAKSPTLDEKNLDFGLEDEYLLLYTSGTTAFPKGVSLSLRAIMANAQGIAQWQHLSHTDRFGIVLPLHHINSTTMSFATLLVGGTIVLYSRYSASQFWQIASQHKVTVTSIVPTILHDLLVRKEEYEPQKHKLAFKRILIGSAPVLPEETLTFMETLDIDVVQGYGQTETALRVTGVPTTLSRKQYKELVKKNSIGKELAYCNVTVLRENGSRAKEKEEGELCVRGPVLADGYWNNAEATEKAFTKEWFHTEDMGYYEQIGGEKYFFMKGRMKEIIIKGGVNISPAAIEDALLKNFPEIQEVCVVGYEDSRMGEEIAAVVRLHGNSPAGGEFAKQVVRFGGEGKLKGLSRYEAPAQVFVTRDELPKTSTGKIQRVQVKAQVAKLIAKKAASHVYCRRVEAYEKVILQKMMELNNKRWSVPATYKEFMQRAQHGYVFGAFDDHENVVGTLSAVRVSRHELETATTWNGITANGTFKNNNEQGEVLVCAAITVDTFSEEQASIAKVPQLLADAVAKDYLKSGLDNVLRFHAKTKGGMKRGASVGRIIPRGRPDDTEAMGYNVVMEYPSIAKVKKIVKSKQASPAVMLIEKAMQVAKEQGCVQVVAFSRPAQFRAHIAKALHNSVPFEVRDVKAFALFAKKVQAAAKK